MAVELTAGQTALVVYDMDNSLDSEVGIKEVLPQYRQFVADCRQAGVLAFFCIGQSAIDLGRTFCPGLTAQGNEKSWVHPHSGIFTVPEVEQHLRSSGRDTLLVTGLAVDRGVNMTARQAMNLGFKTVMVRGLCLTRDITESPVGPVSKQDLERTHLAALYRVGASIRTPEAVWAGIGAG